MDYLKVYTNFVEVIEPLGEAEIGRLFIAMLKYAEQGATPDLRGNERFIWPIAKQNIDRTVVEHEKHIAAKLYHNAKQKRRGERNRNYCYLFSHTCLLFCDKMGNCVHGALT
jgi:hypothetical protein